MFHNNNQPLIMETSFNVEEENASSRLPLTNTWYCVPLDSDLAHLITDGQCLTLVLGNAEVT